MRRVVRNFSFGGHDPQKIGLSIAQSRVSIMKDKLTMVANFLFNESVNDRCQEVKIFLKGIC